MRKGLVWSLFFMVVLSAGSLGGTLLAGNHIVRGLDLKGGVSVVLQPQGSADNTVLDEAVTIIENRVSGLNIANSNVQRQGHDVVVSLPGIKDSQKALAVLGETATLYFRPVDCIISPYAAPTKSTTTTTVPGATTTVPKAGVTPSTTAPKTSTTSPKTSPTTAKSALGVPANMSLAAASFPAAASSSTTTATTVKTTTPTTAAKSPTTATTVPASTGSTDANAAAAAAACSASNSSTIPSTPVGNDIQTDSVILPDYTGTVRYVLGPADMTGAAVKDASVSVSTSTGEYQVNLTFTSKGATEFDKIAAVRYPYYEQNQSNPPAQSLEAFELDGKVQSAPTIDASSFNGQAVISGSSSSPFTSSQANNLALVLKYGSLPVRFVPQSVQTVSATIGKDTLRAGVLAGVGGIVIVMLYMLIYYRALALVVFVGLGLAGCILYSLLALLSQGGHIALTLAGVTGLIVSVGITVDSYIVYFERLKDEVRSGRTVRQSVERSFSRAFRTVLTADLVSFMAAVILYYFSVGDVRNFAFTLGLSTLLDVFTAYFFIRPAVIMLGRRRAFTDNRIFGITRGLGGPVALRNT